MPDRLCIIDADVLVYMAAFSLQKNSVVVPASPAKAAQLVDRFIWQCIKGSGSNSVVCYLTGKSNFRNDLATITPYKQRDSPKPALYSVCKQRIVDNHFGQIVDGMEADDACSMLQYEYNREFGYNSGRSVIASIDKDLKMVPGLHYDIKTQKLIGVTETTAYLNFYSQLLTGDTTDSIYSIHGLGKKTALKILTEGNRGHNFLKVLERIHEELMKDKSKSKFWGRGYTTKQVVTELGNLLWMMEFKDEIYSDAAFEKDLARASAYGDLSFIHQPGIWPVNIKQFKL